ncbi:GNAT family N-acetyltransferase [Nocardia transvalensis]|uniref:GNAT family N-acetyltransferase n=1 Tax=Nocardia transvalensis TaxID=37333 RepID=UPI0018959E89|nr:GNAT family N-acetyltransferase [Nocardia transvalensis]MBF6330327.1 GNAT family N-acetyltransferase [Nocardia transvalensis]
MIVRQLGSEEWRTARTARLNALATSPPGRFSSTFAEAAVWDEQRWRRWLGLRTLFVVESHRQPVGCAGVLFEDGRPYLVSVWVSPVVRGTGASDLLIGSVVDWVRAQGHPELRLWVLDDNAPAEKLYRRQGFVPTGRTRVTAAHSPDTEIEMACALR